MIRGGEWDVSDTNLCSISRSFRMAIVGRMLTMLKILEEPYTKRCQTLKKVETTGLCLQPVCCSIVSIPSGQFNIANWTITILKR